MSVNINLNQGYNLKMSLGLPFQLVFNVSEKINGVESYKDLTGSSVSAAIKESFGSVTSYAMGASISDATKGEITLTVTTNVIDSMFDAAGELDTNKFVNNFGYYTVVLDDNIILQGKIQLQHNATANYN